MVLSRQLVTFQVDIFTKICANSSAKKNKTNKLEGMVTDYELNKYTH